MYVVYSTMLMKQHALSIFCCILCLNINFTMTVDNSQGFQWTIVIKKVTNCNIPRLKCFLENASMQYHYPKTHLDIRFRITDDFKGPVKFILHIERCNDQGYDCEDYQNWSFERFCDMITWKNQIWSELVDRVKPPFKCPIKKGTYEARNASINVDGIMNWCPNVEKHHWKAGFRAESEANDVLFCSVVEVYFQRVRTQDRKLSVRRPKHNSKNVQQ